MRLPASDSAITTIVSITIRLPFGREMPGNPS